MAASADDWWRKAKSEFDDARILKRAGKNDSAYFHAGQSIEFLLKALFLKRNNHPSMPADYKGAHWHDLEACAKVARLKSDINQATKSVLANWMTVKDWKSNARFPDLKVSSREVNDLFVAVCHDRDGVWQWLESIYLKS